MKATVCRIDAWSGATPTTLRLSNVDDERVCHLDGASWRPAIARLPKLRYDIFDGSFGSQLTAPSGELAVQLAAWPELPALDLYDGRVRLWQGEIGASWSSYTLIFDGRVREQPPSGEGAVPLSIGCDDAWLDEPLLDTYAGTGGVQGSIELKGNVIPWLIGSPRFVEGVLIDAVDNIYQLSGGSMAGGQMAFDRLSRLGPPAANYASFAALKAATIANGDWATCATLGLVRLGAPPAGLLTFHALGDNGGARAWVRRPGSIIYRIAERLGKLDRVVVADLDALDAACPYNLSLALTSQTTARDVILSIAQSVNATALIDWLGRLRVKAVQIGTPIGTLASDGSSWPPVATVEQMSVSTPYWRLAQKAAVTNRVHTLGEMALNDPALAAAIAAQEAADAASVRIGRITSDGWLTAGADKQGLMREHDSLTTRFTAAYDKAADLGVAASERATAQADMEALLDFLEAITPDWDNAGVDSPVNGPELDALFYAASVTVAILESAVRGLPGDPGPEGPPGVDGYNTAVVFLFRRASSTPPPPSTVATYTFATGVLTGHNSGWSQEPPPGGEPLYMISATARSKLATDTVEASDWSTPRILAQNGAPGAAGPAGASAIGFVQDDHPGSGQFVSQTWYRPTSKQWFRWTGGDWERILGAISALDVVADSAFLGNAVVVNAKIGNLEVNTIKIAGNSVTDKGSVQMVSGVTVARFATQTLMTLTKTKIESASDLDFDVTLFVQTNDDLNGTVVLRTAAETFDPYFGYNVPLFQYVVPMRAGGTGPGFGMPFSWGISLGGFAAGTHTWQLLYTNNGGDFVNALTVLGGSNLRYGEVKR
ncbi:hypothetical protein M2341_002040 [Sphingobium sp. B7D2B]|uniref:hypothetical protein n=1 Tax=Sphingobium sp. B7D2B TaxID=2940583 RepID=UPI0022253724|nr:hypothetical protein [Sphingobium sp. B7D2B]MCW2366593.1 hypothetical protein [Sphingobium sp. B7D2B]